MAFHMICSLQVKCIIIIVNNNNNNNNNNKYVDFLIQMENSPHAFFCVGMKLYN